MKRHELEAIVKGLKHQIAAAKLAGDHGEVRRLAAALEHQLEQLEYIENRRSLH